MRSECLPSPQEAVCSKSVSLSDALEFAVQYVKTNGETVVAIRGKDSVVVCGQKKVPVFASLISRISW